MSSIRPPTIVLPGVAAALRSTKQLIVNSVQSLSADDPGYFGPGSVSWRIFSHATYGASGIAGVLAQALHPVAMSLVDRHSAFRTDAWRRAHLTADYVFTITFGGCAVADAAAARVRHIHRHIAGTDPTTGNVRRADDADLLLWVHAVHTEYSLRGYQMLVHRLTDAEADRFVAEQVIAAELVGLAREQVPATCAQLKDFLESVPGLRVSEAAREFADMLLGARMPLTMRPFWALHIVAAVAVLPAEVRTAYRFPAWLPRGPVAMPVLRAAFFLMNRGYLLFAPVRHARARMREVGRALDVRRGA